MMERSEILATMNELKLYGMKAAYDEIIATAVKRQHEPQRIVGDLLAAEIAEKEARSIKYQITIAKLPLAKDIDEFVFDGAPVYETLVRDLASGDFLAHQRNIVLVGGTGTGKTHLAIAIARACIRDGARGRFYNVVDLVNPLEAEARAGRQGRIADQAVEGRWVERVQQFCQLVVDGLDGINELVGVEGIHKLGHFFVQGFDRRQQL